MNLPSHVHEELVPGDLTYRSFPAYGSGGALYQAKHFKAPQTFALPLADFKFLLLKPVISYNPTVWEMLLISERLRSRTVTAHKGRLLLNPPSVLHPPDCNPSLLNMKHFAFLAGCFPRGQADEKISGKPVRSLTDLAAYS